MANYKESAVTGTKWVRSWQVVVENKYGQTPKIDFFEEQIVDTGDGSPVSKLIPGQIHEEFTDPSVTFNLINPMDGSAIGTATYQDVYVLMSSLYLSLAQKRDGV